MDTSSEMIHALLPLLLVVGLIEGVADGGHDGEAPTPDRNEAERGVPDDG